MHTTLRAYIDLMRLQFSFAWPLLFSSGYLLATVTSGGFSWLGLVTVALIGFFAVLFTGRWPSGLRDFVLNVQRWYLRVQTYLLLLTDTYPPFRLG